MVGYLRFIERAEDFRPYIFKDKDIIHFASGGSPPLTFPHGKISLAKRRISLCNSKISLSPRENFTAPQGALGGYFRFLHFFKNDGKWVILLSAEAIHKKKGAVLVLYNAFCFSLQIRV